MNKHELLLENMDHLAIVRLLVERIAISFVINVFQAATSLPCAHLITGCSELKLDCLLVRDGHVLLEPGVGWIHQEK
jgi:hypothetical protein